MRVRKTVGEPVTLTKDDWAAFRMAYELLREIALHGHGRRTLLTFATAIVEAEAEIQEARAALGAPRGDTK